MDGLGLAAVQAGFNVAGSLLSDSLSRESEDRAFGRSLQLMDRQNNYNIAQWQRNNAYNSPSNQVELMLDAGINPAMAVSQNPFQPGSEITSADADVPYNQQQGQGYRDIGNGVLQALYEDAQIAKLRTDIKYQELVNRDLQNQLKAKEAPMENLSNVYDEEGRSMTIYHDTNAYDEERQRGRISTKRDAVGYAREMDEYKGFLEDYPFLRDMTQKQLLSLAQDIKTKELNNDLLSEDVRMMKTYGISSQDKNEWTALLRAALHDPENIYRILEALGNAGTRTFKNIFHFFGSGSSDRNPSHRAGSW